jgi:tRNA-splicing ligase RtcB/Helicase conserved C-terminal domain
MTNSLQILFYVPINLQNISIPSPAARMAWLVERLPELPGSGIIYALTIKDADRVAEWLRQNSIRAESYHSQLNLDKKIELEDRLLDNDIKVLVATTALGMGFDKPDLGFVIHKNTHRLLRALAKQGLEVSYQDQIYTVRSNDGADAPAAEVLLPPDFPIEGKAFKPLASLTTLAHPGGGKVTRTLATPDFHPGDTGVAILVPRGYANAIHSGSRTVGKYIGGMWRDRAKAAWLKDYPFPQSSLFALSTATNPDLVAEYLEAEATAANYAFVNRLILAELIRLRLREVYGDLAAPLVCDLPHNLTFPDGDGWIVRKGACAAGAGQLLITPGSMGTPSYLLSGLGNDRYLNSAAHGAGRAISRFELTRAGANYTESDLGLTSGVDCITLRPERRIEEAPAAYKSIDRVIDTQVAAGMVAVVAKMRPILTFKA